MRVGGVDEPGLARATEQGVPANQPDDLTQNRYFVFVHGYNVSGAAARGWHAQVFKRLYRLGFNDRFVGITWHGKTGQDYHRAVLNAFTTAHLLPQKLGQLYVAAGESPDHVTIAAHSLPGSGDPERVDLH